MKKTDFKSSVLMHPRCPAKIFWDIETVKKYVENGLDFVYCEAMTRLPYDLSMKLFEEVPEIRDALYLNSTNFKFKKFFESTNHYKEIMEKEPSSKGPIIMGGVLQCSRVADIIVRDEEILDDSGSAALKFTKLAREYPKVKHKIIYDTVRAYPKESTDDLKALIESI